MLKVHGPIFQKFGLMFHLMNYHSKDENLRFQFKRHAVSMYEAIWYIAVAYILL